MICPICKQQLKKTVFNKTDYSRRCKKEDHSFELYEDKSFLAALYFPNKEEVRFVIVNENSCEVHINNKFFLELKNVTMDNLTQHFQSILKLRAFI